MFLNDLYTYSCGAHIKERTLKSLVSLIAQTDESTKLIFNSYKGCNVVYKSSRPPSNLMNLERDIKPKLCTMFKIIKI